MTDRSILNEQNVWILLGECLTVKNQWGSITGDDVIDHEMSVSV